VRHPSVVSDWIDTNHLGARLVYYRVPATLGPRIDEPSGDDLPVHRLEIKESPLLPWLRRELASSKRSAISTGVGARNGNPGR
jgi:uncharacterized protein YPO0396